jgi:hypothetical protein
MTLVNIKQVLERLEHLMYGYNYCVTYGIDVFDSCTTIKEFNIKLKQTYRDSRPSETKLTRVEIIDFWEEIDFGLTYRGDDTSGLKLSAEKEEQLLGEQSKYKTFIKDYITGSTKIYSYLNEGDIPGYVVWWGYAFVLLNDDRPTVFVYGSASD